MGGTERASGDAYWNNCAPHMPRACRHGIQPLFLLLLAVAVVHEVEAVALLAGPAAAAGVREAEGGLEEGADVVV